MGDFDVLNKLDELYQNIAHHREFDNNLNELRLLYKQYPKWFDAKTIKRINSYKESNLILRNIELNAKANEQKYRTKNYSNKDISYYDENYGKTCNDAKYVISSDGTVSFVR